MSATQKESGLIRFGRIAPTISVSDLGRSQRFYCDVLAFAKVFENGNPVSFMILERDAAELHLSLDSAHKATQQNVAHLMVSDAQSLYEHLVASGIQIVGAIRNADYGMRTFVMADPDGNRIDVGQDL
ncbi:MAG: VOC family protein [Betaproteobacteria bacterium]